MINLISGPRFLCTASVKQTMFCTLKTGNPVEDGDPILNLLQGVSHPEIQFRVGIHLEFDKETTVFIVN